MKKSLKLFAVALCCLAGAAAAEAREAKLALFSFDANAAEDLSNVQAGIAAMLPGRLSMPGQIAVIEQTALHADRKHISLTQAEQLALAKKAGADFLLSGTVTKLGDAISIDARLVSVTGADNPVPIFVQSSGFDAIIPQLNILAQKARKTILEKTTLQAAPAAEDLFASQPYAQPVQPAAAYQGAPDEPENRPHPRRPGKPRRFESDKPRRVYEPVEAGLFASEAGLSATITGKPLNFLCAGDVNGDGKRELIAAGPDIIYVFEVAGATLAQIAEIPTRIDEHVVHIDAGDYNANGIDELYVSCWDKRNARSFVVEFQNKQYARILENQRWFYRAYGLSDGSVSLIGQEAGTATPFNGEIYLLDWKEGKLQSREQFLLPGSQGLYGFGEGDIDADGTTDFLIFDKGFLSAGHKLIMTSTTGKTVWRDTKDLGGSPNFFTQYNGEMEQQERLPLRIICAELTADGRWAVIIANNRRTGGGVAEKLMGYNQGQVQCLLWDGSDLVPNWSSPAVSDSVHDYLLDDLDKDGVQDLIVLSGKPQGLLGKVASRIVLYRFNKK